MDSLSWISFHLCVDFVPNMDKKEKKIQNKNTEYTKPTLTFMSNIPKVFDEL